MASDSEAGGNFSAEERAAMKDRAKELRAESKRGKKNTEPDVLETIAGMPEADAQLASRFHDLVRENAPDLMPKLWYGQPAYALEGKVICFFQAASKFSTRYSTIGFSEDAKLDDGTLWPTSFAIIEFTRAHEKFIGDLVRKAVR